MNALYDFFSKMELTYVALARMSVENTARGKNPASGIDPSKILLIPDMSIQRACFVSIKKSGELRGCIGTITPSCSCLWEEIIANAHAAASRDPRFPPIAVPEIKDCLISVDVLEDPELVCDISKLDPNIFGIILEKDHKKGVLLPNLEGVETVEQQIGITMTKANIHSLEGVTVRRFRVLRFSE